MNKQKMQCGQYNGKSFVDIYKTDQKYCEWVLNLPDPSGSLADFQYYLKRRKKRMTCGKHTGRTFEYICKNHESYCAWVLDLPEPYGCMRLLQVFLQKRAEKAALT